MKQIILTSSVFVIFAISTISQANNDDLYYLKLEVGGAQPIKQKISSGLPTKAKKNNKTAIFPSLAFGYHPLDNTRTEIIVRHLSNLRLKMTQSSPQVNNALTIDKADLNNKASATAVLLQTFFDFADFEKVKFFAGGGVGAARVRSKISGSWDITQAGEEPISQKITQSVKHKSNFAYSLGAGMTLKASNNLSLDLQYAYLNCGKTKRTKDIYNIEFGKQKIHNHLVSLGLRYNFH